MRILSATDAQAMADIHAQSFDRPWPALDMTVHCAKDVCVGFGTPLSTFAIISVAVDQAEILTIATASFARRQGLARRLVNDAVKTMRTHGVRTLFLEVAEDNIAARALYKSCGFDAVGRRPNYYRREGGRMAALTLSLDLAKRLDDTGADG